MDADRDTPSVREIAVSLWATFGPGMKAFLALAAVVLYLVALYAFLGVGGAIGWGYVSFVLVAAWAFLKNTVFK